MYAPAVEQALAFASLRHQGQTRKAEDTPYFTHLVHVALICSRVDADNDTLVVALLHDVLEDTTRGLAERSEVTEDIRSRWGEEVVSAVLTLTEPKRDASGARLLWRDRKQAYLDQLSAGSARACLVSAADKLHNLETLLEALHRDGPKVWDRFWGGPADIRWFYGEILGVLSPRLGADHAVIEALRRAVDRFERYVEARAS